MPYIHVKKILQDPAFSMPIKVQSSEFLLWLTLNTLFVQSVFFFFSYIVMLFDKTGICAVQENIKIYFKLG